MRIRGFFLAKQGSKIRKDESRAKVYCAPEHGLIALAIGGIRKPTFPPSARYLILIFSPYHITSHNNSKITPSKRSASSSANPKKLTRPQRTRQSKNAVELASADLYDIDNAAPTAVNGDDNAASSKGIAKDTEHFNSALLSKLLKVTMSLELRL